MRSRDGSNDAREESRRPHATRSPQILDPASRYLEGTARWESAGARSRVPVFRARHAGWRNAGARVRAPSIDNRANAIVARSAAIATASSSLRRGRARREHRLRLPKPGRRRVGQAGSSTPCSIKRTHGSLAVRRGTRPTSRSRHNAMPSRGLPRLVCGLRRLGWRVAPRSARKASEIPCQSGRRPVTAIHRNTKPLPAPGRRARRLPVESPVNRIA